MTQTFKVYTLFCNATNRSILSQSISSKMLFMLIYFFLADIFLRIVLELRFIDSCEYYPEHIQDLNAVMCYVIFGKMNFFNLLLLLAATLTLQCTQIHLQI